jgi:hypothetical protein
MALVTINWTPTPRELRKFGLAMIVGFALIGTVFLLVLGRPNAAIACYIFGAIAGILGLTGSKIALPVYWAWMAVAYVMGNIISRVLLTLFFYLLITPTGLLRRFFGHDPLQLHRRATASYWHDLPPIKNKKRYERQF